GLKAAHDANLVHRDIKPENIWLKPSGQVKILDFGLARFDTPMDNLTGEGRAVGTPGYLAPEQARGQWVDHRSDLFSFGCVLYELLMGKSPFERDTMMACLTALAIEDPAPIRPQNAAVPVSLEKLVLEMLAKNPDDRPGSAEVVLQQLEQIERRLSGNEREMRSYDLPAQAAPEPFNLIQGDVTDYRTETRELLRTRLRALTMLITLAFAWSMVNDVIWGNPTLVGLRLVLTALVSGIFFLLASKRFLSTKFLQRLDLLLLASVCTLIFTLPTRNMLDAAAAGETSMAVAERAALMTGWTLLILGHALFVPSSWQRAALTLFPLAILSHLHIWLLEQYSPALRQAWDIPFFRMPVRLTFIAAVMGTYGAYIINNLRYQAYQAELLGQYLLKDKIGTGPLGEVFRAEHFQLKRPSAVKLIRPSAEVDSESLKRFEKAIQVAATINHPGIVTVFDYGRARDGVLYFVMELLPGVTAAEIVAEFGPMPPGRVAHLLGQTARALGEAHSFGFFHGNLKPSNLMLSRLGSTYDSVKLLDFGLNRDVGHRQLPAEAALFMSPEQATGERLDGRSDIYSLGAVAYYLLCGKPVFSASNLMQVVVAHSRDPVKALSQHSSDIPADLEAVILRCLEKDPQARFSKVQELEAALAACGCTQGWSEEAAARWWQNARR
ncbi:MAG: protein kinase, partial [Gemmataceae bacterium]